MSRVCSRAQLCSWLVTFLLAPTVSICLLPLAFPIPIAVFLTFYTFVLLQVIIITIYDPAPKSVRDKRAAGFKPALRPSHRGHIIQNGYCTICEVTVPNGSKHCRRCNKCAEAFDHHCVWLNTCIGGRNYRMFLVLIISLSLLLSLSIVSIIVLIILGFTHVNQVLPLNRQGEETRILLEWIEVPLVGWILLDVVVFLLLSLLDVLIIHLLCFHVKLRKSGTTTYSYIQKKRKKTSTRATTDTLTGGDATDIRVSQVAPAPPLISSPTPSPLLPYPLLPSPLQQPSSLLSPSPILPDPPAQIPSSRESTPLPLAPSPPSSPPSPPSPTPPSPPEPTPLIDQPPSTRRRLPMRTVDDEDDPVQQPTVSLQPTVSQAVHQRDIYDQRNGHFPPIRVTHTKQWTQRDLPSLRRVT